MLHFLKSEGCGGAILRVNSFIFAKKPDLFSDFLDTKTDFLIFFKTFWDKCEIRHILSWIFLDVLRTVKGFLSELSWISEKHLHRVGSVTGFFWSRKFFLLAVC